MSKIIDEYIRLHKKDPNKLYLFLCGNFYIFIGNDADYVTNYMVLKKTAFSKDYMKCGFPKSALDIYLKVFNNIKLNVEVINEISNPLDELKKLDLSKLSKEEAINLLERIKNYD